MDDVITRIVEIERQCSADIEQARLEYGKNVETHRRSLEEKKTREHAQIVSEESARQAQAVEDAKRQIEAVNASFRRDREGLFQDPVLNKAIKEDIISILLQR